MPHSSRSKAMTLLEVIIALSIMTIMMASVLSALTQTRRLSASSIAQNCAVTIAQGYIEQIKNLALADFVNSATTDTSGQFNPNLSSSYELSTMKDQTSTIRLWTTPSTVTASTLTGATPGTSPTGAVDNLQSFDMDSRTATGTTTWALAWPGAITFPTTTPGRADLRMNFWVQITDLTPTASPRTKAYGILLVYQWQYLDGTKVKYNLASVRTIRSAVQTM